MIEVTKNVLKEIYKDRDPDLYYRKYDFGLMLVIGGSDFYSGSPALSAKAAFKAGVGMVRIIAPKRAADIIAGFSPDMAAYPLEGTHLGKEHLATLLSMTESAKAVAEGNVTVVIGGGIGRSEDTQNAIIEYLSQIDCPAVIDADAIHAVGKKPEIIYDKPFLITPNPYEFFVLTKKSIYKLPKEEQIKAVLEESARMKTTILLKGKPDIVSNGKETALNMAGSPYMAVGGTGDTLAGICGALMARKIEAFTAAQAAVYINGKAGEFAGEELKESMMASDLIEEIPEVLH